MLGVLASAGCDEPEAPELILLGHTPPVAPACQPRAGQVTHSIMDLTLTERYTFHARLINAGPQDITLEQATISFVPPPNISFVPPQNLRVPVQGIIPAGQEATVPIELVPSQIGAQWAAAPEFAPGQRSSLTLLTELELQGSTLGDGKVRTTGTFTFPVRLCGGCLVAYVPGTMGTDEDGSQTCQAQDGASLSLPLVEPCEPGQDFDTDCRLCRVLYGDPELADRVCDP